jgi:hypothetical protein
MPENTANEKKNDIIYLKLHHITRLNRARYFAATLNKTLNVIPSLGWLHRDFNLSNLDQHTHTPVVFGTVAVVRPRSSCGSIMLPAIINVAIAAIIRGSVGRKGNSSPIYIRPKWRTKEELCNSFVPDGE